MTPFPLRPRALVGLALATLLLGLGAGAGWEAARAQHVHSHAATSKPGWLVRMAPDARPAAIERQLRGFATTMAEVSYRYTEMYWGGVDGNWDYAAHQAQNLATAFTLGLERRPEYKKNADALFLKGANPQIVEAIKAKDAALFKQRVDALRAACTACHAAEAHPFIKIGVPTVRLNPVVSD
jgi:hypothetical protein